MIANEKYSFERIQAMIFWTFEKKYMLTRLTKLSRLFGVLFVCTECLIAPEHRKAVLCKIAFRKAPFKITHFYKQPKFNAS